MGQQLKRLPGGATLGTGRAEIFASTIRWDGPGAAAPPCSKRTNAWIRIVGRISLRPRKDRERGWPTSLPQRLWKASALSRSTPPIVDHLKLYRTGDRLLGLVFNLEGVTDRLPGLGDFGQPFDLCPERPGLIHRGSKARDLRSQHTTSPRTLADAQPIRTSKLLAATRASCRSLCCQSGREVTARTGLLIARQRAVAADREDACGRRLPSSRSSPTVYGHGRKTSAERIGRQRVEELSQPRQRRHEHGRPTFADGMPGPPLQANVGGFRFWLKPLVHSTGEHPGESFAA